MSAAARVAIQPKPTPLQYLLERLAAAERAVDESRLLPAYKRVEGVKQVAPDTRRDIRRVLQLVDSINAKMQALRGVVEPRVLESPVRKEAAAKKPAAKPARDEVRETFERLLSAGELLESARFQERAGITRQALSKAVVAKRMFYLEVGGIRAYPAFYLDASLERAQVEAVTKLLGDLSGGSKWLFFTTPKGSLAELESGRARTPLRALMEGDFDKVKQAAIGHAQR